MPTRDIWKGHKAGGQSSVTRFQEVTMRRSTLVFGSLALLFAGCNGTVGSGDDRSIESLKRVPTGGAYTESESLQVRPLALSPSGKTLFACNTPDNRLEMF